MTLPKNISDAIDTLLRRALETLTSAYAMPADEYLRSCTEPARAALEAAIAASIQPVEPPTDAEVEAWERRARAMVGRNGHFLLEPVEVTEAVALMRRARATGSLERLRDRVEKAQAEIEANAKNFDTMATAGYGLQVLKWIDEELGA